VGSWRNLLLAIIAVNAVSAGTVHAATIDFSASDSSLNPRQIDLDMGQIASNQNGAIYLGNVASNSFIVTGVLSANSMLTFSYTLGPNLNFGTLPSTAVISSLAGNNFGFQFGDTSINGIEADASAIGQNTSQALPNNLVIVTADILDSTHGFVTMTNNYASSINIATDLYYQPNLNSQGPAPVLTYNTSSVSAVPLPSALPLFGSVLLALLGFSRMKKAA